MNLQEASDLLRKLGGFWTKIKHLPDQERPVIIFWDEHIPIGHVDLSEIGKYSVDYPAFQKQDEDIQFEAERILQMLAFTPYEKVFNELRTE